MIKLGLNGVNNFRMAVTDVENAEAAQTVEITTALVVIGINTFIAELNGPFGTGKLLRLSIVEVINRIAQGPGG